MKFKQFELFNFSNSLCSTGVNMLLNGFAFVPASWTTSVLCVL